jgi:hypothetical protein
MAFKFTVEGGIELQDNIIQKVSYKTNTPDDSNARSTDIGAELRITGRIITDVHGYDSDVTDKLAAWSLVPASKPDCYRKATLELINSGQMVRKIEFPNALWSIMRKSMPMETAMGRLSYISGRRKIRLIR